MHIAVLRYKHITYLLVVDNAIEICNFIVLIIILKYLQFINKMR